MADEAETIREGLCDADNYKRRPMCGRGRQSVACVMQMKPNGFCVAEETKREAVCGRVRQRRACLLQMKPKGGFSVAEEAKGWLQCCR